MTVTALKKRIIRTLDKVNDTKTLQLVYDILEHSANPPQEYELTPAQKKELDRRMKLHKQGKMKYYTLAEIRKKVRSKYKNK
jgi:putative addiction module component (TIGR02574 family)